IGAIDLDGVYAQTLMTPSGVAGIFYYLPVSPGVVEVCSVVSALAFKYRKSLHIAALSLLDIVASDPGVRRIQATVDAECHRAIRWIERLGFEFEGRLRSYGPDGRDHLIYGRVK